MLTVWYLLLFFNIISVILWCQVHLSIFYCISPLPQNDNFRLFHSAANKDMMSKYGQMGIQLSGRVENIEGKGEIARDEQFLLFPQCFQKLSVLMCQNEYLWSKELTVSFHIIPSKPLAAFKNNDCPGSKKFLNFYSSSCHFTLFLQLDKEG